MAGLGNIYVDEALFEARIRPDTSANRLSPAAIKRLHASSRAVLERGIANRGASFSDYVDGQGNPGEQQMHVQVFRRTGKPCYTCGTPIERIVGRRPQHALLPEVPAEAAHRTPGSKEMTMLIDAPELLALLHLPPGTPVETEPISMYPSLAERVSIGTGEERKAVVVRSNMDDDLAQNHAAITDVLTSALSGPVPRVYAIQAKFTVEEDVAGVSTLALQLPPAAMDMAVDIIAQLHALPVREGLRQGDTPESTIETDLPLYRLGFTSTEREAAAPHLAKARELLLEYAPFGFVHGECTADRVLIGSRPRMAGRSLERWVRLPALRSRRIPAHLGAIR